jgi:putative transposase
MPRQPRLVVPDLPVHIIQRGNDRQACFKAERDYLVYLALLRELAEKSRCRLHAYCLMTNHVHLLVTPGSENACAVLMRGVSQRYSQYFNRTYGRTGTLWEGRFRSCLVESAEYVLACHRYIELNPVRAGLTQHPGHYAWSSYLTSIGASVDPSIVLHPDIAGLGRAEYASIVAHTLEPELLLKIRDCTNGGYPLGSEPFKQSLKPRSNRKLERSRPGPPAKLAKGQIASSEPDRDLFGEFGT